MTKTPAERQAEYRQRRIALGLKAMTLWLPPEALAVLERYPREQRDGIAAQAILAYNGNVTVSDSNSIHPALEALTRRVEALEGALTLRNSGVTNGNSEGWQSRRDILPVPSPCRSSTELAPWDISVQGHIEHEAQGEAVALSDTPLPKPPARLPDLIQKAKNDLIQKAKKQNAEGASWAEIARRWNASGIPTLSGKGQWHRKTVARMVENE